MSNQQYNPLVSMQETTDKIRERIQGDDHLNKLFTQLRQDVLEQMPHLRGHNPQELAENHAALTGQHDLLLRLLTDISGD